MSKDNRNSWAGYPRPIVVMGYVIFGIAWILIGESQLNQISAVSGFQAAHIEVAKGLIFVALSGVLIFALQMFEARLAAVTESALGSKTQEAENYRKKYEGEAHQRRQADVILEALSAANREIVSAHSKEAIAKSVCDRVAETTGYPLVWFGKCAQIGGEKVLIHETSSGVDAQVAKAINFNWDGDLSTPNPITSAIKTGNLQTRLHTHKG